MFTKSADNGKPENKCRILRYRSTQTVLIPQLTLLRQAKYHPVGKFTEVDDEEFVNIDEYDVEIDEDDLNLDDDEEFPFIEHANDDLDEETEDGDVDSYEAVTPVTPVIEDRTNPRSSNLSPENN
ncbi:hypothetical protein X801_04630 [Opisthorchis viverrini]|uniref:Uncharacterized protein n=1 Tax=Opisthorchis viverrini TaxID=6198 RepID=A0A1S8WZ39_OPIVI|nr:hypothetical protein X801_04630 [Opisthorchis viverrini]